MTDVSLSEGPAAAEDAAPALTGRRVFTASDVSCGTSKSLVAGYRDFLVEHGAHRVDDAKDADIILVDTCAFSAQAEARSLAHISQQQDQARRDAKIIVTGCLAGINPDAIKKVFDGEMFSPKNQAQLGEIFGIGASAQRYFKPRELRSGFMEPRTYEPLPDWTTAHQAFWRRLASSLHAINAYVPIEMLPAAWRVLARSQQLNPRAFTIAISQGCIGNCAFCAIPFAKGRTQSVQLGAIVDKIKESVAGGVKDIVLTSEDTGAYGIDIGITPITLLEHINKLAGNFRVHLAFFDPRWLKKYEAGLMRALEGGRVRSLQFPLQSGSNAVLRAMRRGYQVEHALPVIHRIRTAFPEICVLSQFIAGFPGETEDDFRATMAVVEADYFDFAQAFAFEDRPGTPTNTMKNHLPADVRITRAREIKDFYRRKSTRLLFRSVPVAAAAPV